MLTVDIYTTCVPSEARKELTSHRTRVIGGCELPCGPGVKLPCFRAVLVLPDVSLINCLLFALQGQNWALRTETASQSLNYSLSELFIEIISRAAKNLTV